MKANDSDYLIVESQKPLYSATIAADSIHPEWRTSVYKETETHLLVTYNHGIYWIKKYKVKRER